MAKIERTCKECVFYAKKECVGKIQPCHKWIYKKANCRVCTFLDDCHSLGKGVSSEKVCLNFKKSSNPPKNIDKYETEIIDEEPEFSPVDLVENIISQDYDSRIFQLIDDRDIPKATNPVKFIISKKFLGINVFPMQLKIFLEFFSAYCPFCSDTKFIKNIAVDTKIENILDKTVPYTNGICPKCKRTKYEAFDSGKSERYDNLIGVAGQRSGKCIHSKSLIPTNEGILEIGEIAEGKPLGFSDFKIGVSCYDNINYIVKNTSKFYKEVRLPLIKIRLKNGYSITGTSNHPILTTNNYIKLSNIEEGMVIPIEVGQNVWGSELLSLKEVVEKSEVTYKQKWDKNTKIQWNMRNDPYLYNGKLNKSICRFLGYWVSEGANGGISNQDQDILKDCEKTLVKLFGRDEIDRSIDFVGWRSIKTRIFIEELLGFDIYCKSGGQRVPICIRKAPKEYVSEFLKALFEGDGSVCGDCIEYSTISKDLSNHVSALLHNFGVIHQIRITNSWATNGSENQISKKVYRLLIEGPKSLRVFRELIGFVSDRKKESLNDLITHYDNRTLDMPFWYEKYPDYMKQEFIRCFEELKEILNTHKAIHGKILGLQSIWGINLSDIARRLYDDNVCLTKRKIINLVTPMLSSYISTKIPNSLLVKFLNFYSSALNDNLYFTTVKKKSTTKKALHSYDFTVPYYHNFIANGLNNHNSISVGILAATVLHQFLTLKGNPVEFFGLLPNSTLHGTFVGLRYNDAFDNLWEPFYNLLKSSKWYQNYHSFLQSEGQRIGVELVKVRDTFIAYKWKNIGIYPSGPDRRTLRGRTRIIACLSGDSLVETSVGSVRIDSITLDHLVKIYGLTYKINNVFYNGKQQVYKIKTSLGYHIKATCNHKFLTVNKQWKKVSELRKNSTIRVILNDYFVTYDSIEEIILDEIIDVYDIEVDSEDHAYIANGFIVHNSLDELGWFMGSDGSMKLDPDGVYEALDNSLMTVQTASRKLFKKFPDIPTAVGMYISSPSSKTDKSMRLYKQSLTSSRLFGFHASTWEFNPNITREDLQQKYNEDPIAAERDFGANPPFGISPYIKGPSSLVNVFSSNKNVFINKGYKVLEGSLNESLLYPKISFAQKHTYPSILSIDCSYNNNSFACVLSHLELDENNDKKFVVSGIIEIVPVPYPISFVSVYEKVICRIIENYEIQLVVFDRWQSIDLSQRIFKDYGINSFWYSVKYAEFELFKAEVYGETAQFPKLESDLEELIELDTEMSSLTTLKPCNHFFLQLLMCKDTGRMVTKGDDVTDDILRAVILGYAVINKDEYIELFTGIGNKINSSYMDIRNIVKVGYKSVSNKPVSNVPNFNAQQRTTTVPGIGSFRRRG